MSQVGKAAAHGRFWILVCALQTDTAAPGAPAPGPGSPRGQSGADQPLPGAVPDALEEGEDVGAAGPFILQGGGGFSRGPGLCPGPGPGPGGRRGDELGDDGDVVGPEVRQRRHAAVEGEAEPRVPRALDVLPQGRGAPDPLHEGAVGRGHVLPHPQQERGCGTRQRRGESWVRGLKASRGEEGAWSCAGGTPEPAQPPLLCL